MNHLGKSIFYVVCCLAGLPCMAASDGTTTMYKLVDSQGKVTYSNTPIAGAVRVALEPITVLVNSAPASQRPQTAAVTPTVAPFAPAASPASTGDTTIADDAVPSVVRVPVDVAVAVVAPVTPKRTVAPKLAAGRPQGAGSASMPVPVPIYSATEIISPTDPVATPPMRVAVVTPMANPKIKPLPLPAELQPPSEESAMVKTATVLTPPTTPVTTGKSMPPVAVVTPVVSKLAAKQAAKPLPVQSSIQAAIESEQKLLASAKAALDEENGQSEGVRAIKATFNASAKTSVNNGGVKLAQVPVITAEERQKVVHHFDRIRDLQDAIAAHEKTIDDLRRDLTAGKSVPVNPSENKTATLAAARNLH